MELCIFSGTFNPIHNGHLYMAEYVITHFGISKILFIPAFVPPMKDTSPELAKHRYKMVELTIKTNPHFEISDIEYKHSGKSYTYRTVLELCKIYKPKNKIKFIIGTDAFKQIESWYETDKLKEYLHFLVFTREKDFNINELSGLKNKNYDFELMPLEFEDISSTEIRRLAADNKDLSKYVPKEVEEYIKKNELYKD